MSCERQHSGAESVLSDELSSEEEDYDIYYEGGDEDVGGLGEEDAATDASFQKDPEHYLFTCLSEEEVWNYLDMQVRDLAHDLKEDAPVVRGLLHSLRWDQLETKKRYSEDQEKLLVSAHVKPNKKDLLAAPGKLTYCPVCLVPFHDVQSFSMVCGHTFCFGCWREYLKERIMSGQATSIECMQCSVRMSLDAVRVLLSGDARCFSKYQSYSLAEFVQSHHLLRWCPGVNCSIVFQVKQPQPRKVTCSKCSTSCCFKCGEPYHLPADCECYRHWIRKCQDDSETANYILANTKDCPQCHASIEKNGGCNHMHCSRCNYDFCWMCLGGWNSHSGYYNCSKYEESEEKEKTRARKALERYLFYYQRWATHDQSLKLEEVTRQKMLDRIEGKVAASSGTWIDWQYLLDAADLLRKCRYTLKYTYPFAYLLEGDRKPLFEFQQAELEYEIENLSWKVERAETTDVADIRQQMNRTEVKRLTLLRDFVPF